MEQKTQEALDFVRVAWETQPFDGASYLAACEYLIDHRDDLSTRVFIVLPGGLSGNTDTKWDKVKAGSDERCSCGNERVILPLNPREEFRASEQKIVVSPDSPAYLKPVGGDKASAYFKLWIEEGKLAYMDDPFAPLVLNLNSLFSTPAYDLQQLSGVVEKEPTLIKLLGEHKVPVFRITNVDLPAQSVTIVPDQDVEAFDPDAYEDGHACSETQ